MATDDYDRLVGIQRAALAPGEEITKALASAAPSGRPSDEEISDKYDRGEVRIVTEQARYPLESIRGMLGSDNYTLDPDYQRRHRWTTQQKSRLIESFIMNVPVPPLFLYEWDYNKYEVMDGLQRLTAVREFYADVFELSGLEYWTELEGLPYSKLPSRIRDGINRRYLSSIILLRETTHGAEDPERLKRFVFGRINTGGVHLAPQEVRNALYDGPMNQLCKALSRDKNLRIAWDIPLDIEIIVDSRTSMPIDEESALEGSGEAAAIPKIWREMGDVELVLRFFANRQRMIVYRDNIRGYLDDYLIAANGFSREVLAELRRTFEETMALCVALFDSNAFRKRVRGKWREVPSVSVYDAVTSVLSRMLDDRQALEARRVDILDGLDEFYEVNSKVFNLRGQTRGDVMSREMKFETYIRGFL